MGWHVVVKTDEITTNKMPIKLCGISKYQKTIAKEEMGSKEKSEF